MHIEFVVFGPAISNQQRTKRGKSNLIAWRTRVLTEVQQSWPRTPLGHKLRAVLINFHHGEIPPLDLDNMAKPILDAMKDVVYLDDRQIRQAALAHVRIGAPLMIADASPTLASAIRSGKQFVYVRVEDVLEPFPLASSLS